jgi:arginyl-tRNA synthetase
VENLFAEIRLWVLQELAFLVPALPDDILARVELTPARDAAYGDMASNAALVVAKPAAVSPREIATALASR